MKVFAFDRAEARRSWGDEGYVHLKNAVTPDFLHHLQELVRRFKDEQVLDTYGLAGAKDQLLFDPPAPAVWDEIFDAVSEMTGLERSRLTLSERHVKMYNADADPMPAPHKDRLASTVALGISISIPAGSHVVLYPDDQRDENPYLGPVLRNSLEPDEVPEVSLAGAREVELHDSPGDVMAFHGASTWHLRRNSANATLLYLKFNDFDSDPLGEDPSTPERDAETDRWLERASIEDARVRLARRFDSLLERHSRRGWTTDWTVDVFGDPPFSATTGEAVIIRAAAHGTSVAQLVDMRPGGLDAGDALASIRRLARRRALELY